VSHARIALRPVRLSGQRSWFPALPCGSAGPPASPARPVPHPGPDPVPDQTVVRVRQQCAPRGIDRPSRWQQSDDPCRRPMPPAM